MQLKNDMYLNYDYLIEPNVMIGRHPYWTNFKVQPLEVKNIECLEEAQKKNKIRVFRNAKYQE